MSVYLVFSSANISRLWFLLLKWVLQEYDLVFQWRNGTNHHIIDTFSAWMLSVELVKKIVLRVEMFLTLHDVQLTSCHYHFFLVGSPPCGKPAASNVVQIKLTFITSLQPNLNIQTYKVRCYRHLIKEFSLASGSPSPSHLLITLLRPLIVTLSNT